MGVDLADALKSGVVVPHPATVAAPDARTAAREQLRRERDSLIAEIVSRAKDPWVPLLFGGRALEEVPLGSYVVIAAGTGLGKSSAANIAATEHAETRGPAIIVPIELGGDGAATRIIAGRVDMSWRGVLEGGVPADRMREVLPERLVFHEGDTSEAALRERIALVRRAYPGEPIMLVLDYLQIAPPVGDEIRQTLTRYAEGIRRLTKSERIVLVLISQTSRAAGRGLRDGERMGADTTDVGAETAQIERGAALTIALGLMGPPNERGWHNVEINIGKSRYGRGNRVQPARFHGPSGRWLLDGESQDASEVRAARESQGNAARVSIARLAIVATADKSSKPMTGRELRDAVKVKSATATAAIAQAVDAKELVECPARPRSNPRYPTYWTPARLATREESDDAE